MKIAVENANLCGKICDMRTLLKYAKNAAISVICSNRIFAQKTDMRTRLNSRYRRRTVLPGVYVGGVKQQDDDEAGNDGSQDDHEDREEGGLVLEVAEAVGG